MAVYLLHFERPIAHAQHYLGFAESSVDDRITRHRSGNGARLVAEFVAHGIDFTVARIWPDGDRKFERRLKKQHNSRRHCPECKEGRRT
jgi:hypothetical protein